MAEDPAETPLRRNGAFLRLWTGETFSWFGENIGNFVIPIIAVTVLSASAFEMGLLATFERLAFLLIGLPAGAWVDRWLKRRTMLTVDLTRALLLAAIPVLWLTGALAFWQLLAIATAVGVLSVFFDVAYQSFVPLIVAKQQVAPANGRLETSAQVASLAGPAIGGGLIAIIAAPISLFVTGATYLLSFLSLTSIRDHEQPKPKDDRRTLVVEIKEGLVWVFRQPLLVRIVLCTAIGNLFTNVAFTMLPILALRDLAIPEWLYGLIATVSGAGGLIGALLATRFARWLGEGTVIPVTAIGFSVFGLLIPLAAGLPSFAAAAMLAGSGFLFGLFVVPYNVAQVSYRQRICPPELLGRMNASIRCIIWGVIPIAGFLSGVFATWWGVIPTIWIGVGGAILSCAPVVFSRLMGMRVLPVQAD